MNVDEYYIMKARADSYKTILQWVMYALNEEFYTREEIIAEIEYELIMNQ